MVKAEKKGVDGGLRALEDRLFDGNRLIYSFVPVIGPVVAGVSGYRANRDYKEQIKAQRAAVKEQIRGVKDDEAKMREKYGAKGGDGASNLPKDYDGPFDVRRYDGLNSAIEAECGPVDEIVSRYGYNALRGIRRKFIRDGYTSGKEIPSYRQKKEEEKSASRKVDDESLAGLGEPEGGNFPDFDTLEMPGYEVLEPFSTENRMSDSREISRFVVPDYYGDEDIIDAEFTITPVYHLEDKTAQVPRLGVSYDSVIEQLNAGYEEFRNDLINKYGGGGFAKRMFRSAEEELMAEITKNPKRSFKVHRDYVLRTEGTQSVNDLEEFYGVRMSEKMAHLMVNAKFELLEEKLGSEKARKIQELIVRHGLKELEGNLDWDHDYLVESMKHNPKGIYEAFRQTYLDQKGIEGVTEFDETIDAYLHDRFRKEGFYDRGKKNTKKGRGKSLDEVVSDDELGKSSEPSGNSEKKNFEDNPADRAARRNPALGYKLSKIMEGKKGLGGFGVDKDGRAFLYIAGEEEKVPLDVLKYALSDEQIAEIQEMIRNGSVSLDQIVTKFSS